MTRIQEQTKEIFDLTKLHVILSLTAITKSETMNQNNNFYGLYQCASAYYTNNVRSQLMALKREAKLNVLQPWSILGLISGAYLQPTATRR